MLFFLNEVSHQVYLKWDESNRTKTLESTDRSIYHSEIRPVPFYFANAQSSDSIKLPKQAIATLSFGSRLYNVAFSPTPPFDDVPSLGSR